MTATENTRLAAHAAALTRATEPPDQALDETVRHIWKEHGADAARDALRLAVIGAPDTAAILTCGAQSFFDQEHWDLAATTARWSALIQPKTPNADMFAAACLFRARRPGEAVRHADRAMANAPGNAGPYFLKGRGLIASGMLNGARVDEGMRWIAEAARLDPVYRAPAQIMRLALTAKDFDRVKASVAAPPPMTEPYPDS